MKRLMSLFIVLLSVVSFVNADLITYTGQNSYLSGDFTIMPEMDPMQDPMQDPMAPPPMGEDGYYNYAHAGFNPFVLSYCDSAQTDYETSYNTSVQAYFESDTIYGSISSEADSSYSDNSNSGANTYVDVDFTIDQDCDFTISGTLNEIGNTSAAYVRIWNSSNQLVYEAVTNMQLVSFSDSGTLAAGDYNFVAYTYASSGYQGQYQKANMDFDFELTAVPEPMTMALLGLGGILMRRRKA